jgi:DNA-binding transcriptional ArsR family regulator
MRETEYRASRLCRVLGNPIAYQILKALGHNKKRPLELARSLGRGPSTIYTHLRALKLIDLVRYETKAGKRGVGIGVKGDRGQVLFFAN